ncbi:MAG: hydroxypyruvate reductase, partial [Planctomycetes bacterium]|nr:hydroxypyruvate reductase [Planctomycetota bacterium]
RAAEQALARVEQLRAAHPERLVAVVTTGELSVPLPAAVGVGGRNQHFTLACAQLIRGQPIAVLSCGTDGVDGNSSAAGAVADGETGTRAADAQLDVDDHLRRFDAHTLLRRLGCTIETGPTGVNVRDLRILIARPS